MFFSAIAFFLLASMLSILILGQNFRHYIESALQVIMGLFILYFGVIQRATGVEQLLLGGVGFMLIRNIVLSERRVFKYPAEILALLLLVDISNISIIGLILFVYYVFTQRDLFKQFISLLLFLLGYLQALGYIDLAYYGLLGVFLVIILLKLEFSSKKPTFGFDLHVLSLVYILNTIILPAEEFIPHWFPCLFFGLLVFYFKGNSYKRNLAFIGLIFSSTLLFEDYIPFFLALYLVSLSFYDQKSTTRGILLNSFCLAEVTVILLSLYGFTYLGSYQLGSLILLPVALLFLLIIFLNSTVQRKVTTLVDISVFSSLILGLGWGLFL